MKSLYTIQNEIFTITIIDTHQSIIMLSYVICNVFLTFSYFFDYSKM